MLDEENDDFESASEVEDDAQEMNLGIDDDESLNYDDWEESDIQQEKNGEYTDVDGDKECIAMSKQWYKRIDVDLWKSDMHMATMGIRQKDQYRAQSRQFTANMKVSGDIEFYGYSKDDLKKDWQNRGKVEKKDYKEVFGINKSYWDYKDKDTVIAKTAEKFGENGKGDYEPKKFAPFLRRMVVKLFSELKRDTKKKGHAGRWRGTMEESVIHSINASFGEHTTPRPAFYISLPGYRYRVLLQRTHSYIGDRYAFTLPNPTTGELTSFLIEGKRATPGKDFNVYYAETGEKVADIDERKMNIGGKVTITFNDEPEYEGLNKSSVFVRILVLFAGSIKFLEDVNKKYDKAMKALEKKADYRKELRKAEEKGDQGKIDQIKAKYEKMQWECKMIKSLIVNNSELTLHLNPRRVR